MKVATIARQDFPFFTVHPDCIYLDSAATTHKPKCVIDAITKFYSEDYATVNRAVYELAALATERYQSVRSAVCAFMGANSSSEIIFTRGTTDAINLVAQSFGEVFISEGDEIVVSEMEHHSNIVPWQMLCARKKALLKVIPVNERGELLLSEYEKILSARTKLVAVAHVANATGTVNPIEEIIHSAHKKGAKVLIDGAQSAGHLPIDVRSFRADFYAFSGHKAFGPTGVGVLYGKQELLDTLPPHQGGGDMIERVTMEKTTYRLAPLKFEAGTPMIAQVIGLGEAIDYLNKIGLSQIHSYETALLKYATDTLSTISNLRIIGNAAQKGPIISFIIEGLHPLDIGMLLDLEGICVRTGHHCAQPLMQRFGISGTIRLSFALYNTFEEIDRFVDALKKAIHKLSG